MMRGVNGGDSRAAATNNNALETINAAASAIVASENRVPQAIVQKRRWGSWWSGYWCFGHHRNRKRIGHAILVPEASASRNNASAEISTQAPANVLPFVAPPSSPASFLQSEPPSVTQSPAGVLSLTSISASMYSPSGPASIFAVGPYAHETQLVSPPFFSTFTTEPSTAPYTPPPESVHLTTPSSPEVPFAQLLDPSLQNSENGQRFPMFNYEFQSYQLYPGSPVGQLISPGSCISGSGTSSPFPDGEFATGGPNFLQFQMGDPPKLLNLDKLSSREWGSRQDSGTLTPDSVRPTSASLLLDTLFPDGVSHPCSDNEHQNEQDVDHRLSFELTAEDALRCVEQKPKPLVEDVPESLGNGTTPEREEHLFSEPVNNIECRTGETSNDIAENAPLDVEEPQHSITLGSIEEFNFENTDGGDSHKHNISSDWWINGRVVGEESGTSKNWSFFPMIHQAPVS